jgi:hypothetical protein
MIALLLSIEGQRLMAMPVRAEHATAKIMNAH